MLEEILWAINYSGDTPLHYAVVLNNPMFAKELILKGANFLLANKHKSTAADIAQDPFYRKEEVIDVLRRPKGLVI